MAKKSGIFYLYLYDDPICMMEALSQAQVVKNQEGPYCLLPILLIGQTEILC